MFRVSVLCLSSVSVLCPQCLSSVCPTPTHSVFSMFRCSSWYLSVADDQPAASEFRRSYVRFPLRSLGTCSGFTLYSWCCRGQNHLKLQTPGHKMFLWLNIQRENQNSFGEIISANNRSLQSDDQCVRSSSAAGSVRRVRVVSLAFHFIRAASPRGQRLSINLSVSPPSVCVVVQQSCEIRRLH